MEAIEVLKLPVTETLELKLTDQVLYIWLNRPRSRNAMSLQMVHELRAVFAAIADSDSARAVVLRGKGETFCSGGDIKDMAAANVANNNAPDNRLDNSENHDPFFALNREFGRMITEANQIPQVLITVLEGAVLGGGFGLACVSDIAYAVEGVKFGLPETGLGIPPAQIAPFVAKRIGLTQARRLMLLGSRLNGSEALRIGLIHQLFEDQASVENTTMDTLRQIKRCAPNANAITKQILLATETMEHEALLDFAAKHFSEAIQGDEGKEGTMAFIQKRLPAWAQ